MNFASAQNSYGNEPLGKKYHKQDVGKDFYHSRVIRAVPESLHLRIDFHFFVSVSARHGRKKNLCKHKDERSLTHYINDTTSAQKRERSKNLRDTFQPQLVVQQEASGITGQNSARSSAGPSSNSNPQSLLQNQFISLAQSNQNCTQHI